MSVSKLFAAIGVVALLCGLVAGLVSATATVSTSPLPDLPVVDIAVQLPGALGVSVSPDSESLRVECGSVFARTRHELEDANFVQSALGAAERVESAIEAGCEAALEPRAALVTGAAILGVLLLLLSAALTILAAVGRAARRTGPATSRVLPATQAAPPGMAVVGAEEPLRTPAKRRTSAGAAVAGGVLALAIGMVAVSMSSRSSESVEVSVASVVQLHVDSEEQACARRAIEQSNAAVNDASGASAIDRDNASLNLDGDSSFSNAADRLRRVDLSGCPSQFQAAFVRWTGAWEDFGAFVDEAARPHAPWNDEWSASNLEDELCAHSDALRGLSRQLSIELTSLELRTNVTTLLSCS